MAQHSGFDRVLSLNHGGDARRSNAAKVAVYSHHEESPAVTTMTRALGAALIVIGVVAYLATGTDSPTALIPAALGVVIVALGVLAGRASLHRHAIHGALVVALLGALGTLMNVVELPELLTGRDVERPGAVIAATLTFVLCAAYIAAGIRSFRSARRSPSPAAVEGG